MTLKMKPIAITQGDPAGIGPEIIVKAFRDAPDVTQGCFVVGDVATLRRAAQCVVGALPVAVLDGCSEALAVPPHCLPVLPCGALAAVPTLGQVSASAGRSAAECVVWAANAALRGEVSALVTAPLHKEALALAGSPHADFPGHTEMLQALCAAHTGQTLVDLPVRLRR